MNVSIRCPSLLISVCAIVFALAGCRSAPPPDLSRETPQPVLTGEAAFLDGALQASALFGPFRRGGPPGTPGQPGEQRPGSGDRGSGVPPPREGGFGGGGPRPGGGMGPSGGMGPPPGAPSDAGPGAGDRPRMANPIRHTLTVAFRNNGAEPVQVRVTDIGSLIGNFVAFPETFTIAPGETQPLEPMHSSYPENFSELGVRIRIRTGESRDGPEEEHEIKLTIREGEPPVDR